VRVSPRCRAIVVDRPRHWRGRIRENERHRGAPNIVCGERARVDHVIGAANGLPGPAGPSCPAARSRRISDTAVFHDRWLATRVDALALSVSETVHASREHAEPARSGTTSGLGSGRCRTRTVRAPWSHRANSRRGSRRWNDGHLAHALLKIPSVSSSLRSYQPSLPVLCNSTPLLKNIRFGYSR
jgi:hypothetical protein